MAVQAAGGSSLSCVQYVAVASADAVCLPAVKRAMLALVANVSVVPAPYQAPLTAQVTALFTNPCASPPPVLPPPAPAVVVPASLMTAVQSALVTVRNALRPGC
jgi:hypothetical protein